MSHTTLDIEERYWWIPRVFFERNDIEESPMYCENGFGTTVEDAKEFMRSNQAYGENMVVGDFEEYPLEGRVYSQEIL